MCPIHHSRVGAHIGISQIIAQVIIINDVSIPLALLSIVTPISRGISCFRQLWKLDKIHASINVTSINLAETDLARDREVN